MCVHICILLYIYSINLFIYVYECTYGYFICVYMDMCIYIICGREAYILEKSFLSLSLPHHSVLFLHNVSQFILVYKNNLSFIFK